MFVQGLGRQVHKKMKTKPESFLRAASPFSHPSQAPQSLFQGPVLQAVGSRDEQETTD